jgi:hypothetical protein
VAEGGSDNPVVDLSGKLWGGNLAMLVSLLGTPYFPAARERHRCFIEDISEHPYRARAHGACSCSTPARSKASERWCWVIFQATS